MTIALWVPLAFAGWTLVNLVRQRRRLPMVAHSDRAGLDPRVASRCSARNRVVPTGDAGAHELHRESACLRRLGARRVCNRGDGCHARSSRSPSFRRGCAGRSFTSECRKRSLSLRYASRCISRKCCA
jgi:hypothetical protein